MVKRFLYFIKENLGWISTPVTLFVMQFIIGGIPHLPSTFMYVGFSISGLYLLLDKDIRINSIWVVFLMYIALSILVAQPDPLFQSPMRFGLFATLLVSASSLIDTPRARTFRRQCLNISGVIACIIAIGSFPCYFLGINFFESNYEEGFLMDYMEQAGHFAGLTTHSMRLGPLSGFSMVYLFYYTTVKKQKALWPLIIMSAGSALFAASRGALIAAIFGFIVVMYFTSSSKGVFNVRILRLMAILVIAFPLWSGALDGVIRKQETRSQQGGTFDSRTGKVEARIAEFKSSPIYGIGFASVDPNGNDGFNPRTGQIEPGSSWLAVLAQTGIIGFILCVIIFMRSYKYCRDAIDPYRACLLGLLVFYSIHMLIEGYAFAGGNPTTFMLWLVVGNCYDCLNEKKIQ